MAKVTLCIGSQGLHTIDLVSPPRAGGGRETPVAATVLLFQAVFDLRLDVERVVHSPAPRCPAILGDEEGDHQGFEHAPAPARDDPGALVTVMTFEDLDPLVFPSLSAGYLPLRSQPLGQRPEQSIVVFGR